jgi:hypothetical protein
VNDYSTATDLGNALSKTENGLICNGTYNRYVWAYNSCGYSTETSLISSTLSCFICGSTITINHLIPGGIAPVGKTVTYGTLSGMNGEPSKCWITSNLGSDQQAPAVNDATEASAGWYWQFNRKQGYKHDGTNRTPDALWIEGINESSNWFTANDPCNLELGTQWRIPTYTEWYNVDNIGGWTNWNGPWGSGLKLHAAGFLYPSDGSLYYRGSGGYYWSSTQYSATYGWHLYFDIGYSTMSDLTKAGGFSLRCLRE